MRCKSPRVFVVVLLLGLLLATSTRAYGEAVSFSALNFNNLQITATGGSIQFAGPWQANAFAQAMNSQGGLDSHFDSSTGGTAQANATVTFASGFGSANAANLTGSGNSQLNIAGCTCQASSVGQSLLTNSFMITGGSGNVDVNFSALLSGMQSVMTDSYGQLAESEVIFSLELDGNPVLFYSSLFSVGPNSSMQQQIAQQLSTTLTLQFDTTYSVAIALDTESPRGINSVPEPSTVVLMISGLGFMRAFASKKRNAKARRHDR